MFQGVKIILKIVWHNKYHKESYNVEKEESICNINERKWVISTTYLKILQNQIKHI